MRWWGDDGRNHSGKSWDCSSAAAAAASSLAVPFQGRGGTLYGQGLTSPSVCHAGAYLQLCPVAGLHPQCAQHHRPWLLDPLVSPPVGDNVLVAVHKGLQQQSIIDAVVAQIHKWHVSPFRLGPVLTGVEVFAWSACQVRAAQFIAPTFPNPRFEENQLQALDAGAVPTLLPSLALKPLLGFMWQQPELHPTSREPFCLEHLV